MIVAAIQQLSPAQRRQLQRHLRVSGLLVPENSLTDQDRLRVAPALGLTTQTLPNTPGQQPQSGSGSTAYGRGVVPIQRIEANRPAAASVYQSPVNGKVVVGGGAG